MQRIDQDVVWRDRHDDIRGEEDDEFFHPPKATLPTTRKGNYDDDDEDEDEDKVDFEHENNPRDWNHQLKPSGANNLHLRLAPAQYHDREEDMERDEDNRARRSLDQKLPGGCNDLRLATPYYHESDIEYYNEVGDNKAALEMALPYAAVCIAGDVFVPPEAIVVDEENEWYGDKKSKAKKMKMDITFVGEGGSDNDNDDLIVAEPALSENEVEELMREQVMVELGNCQPDLAPPVEAVPVDEAVNGRRKWIVRLSVFVTFAIIGAVLLALLITKNKSSASAVAEKNREYLLRVFEPFLSQNGTSVSRMDILESPSSPQYKAIQWMSSNDAFSRTPEKVSTSVLLERYSLAVLYFSTARPNRDGYTRIENNLDWLSSNTVCQWNVDRSYDNKTINETLLDPYQWNWTRDSKTFLGTFCNRNGSVSALNLYNMGLIGRLPWELSFLSSLELLSLGKNNFTRMMPPEYVSLTNLVHMNVSTNEFTGSLPSHYSMLSNLFLWDISSNLLNGTISSELALLTNLNTWNIGQNKLYGDIPSDIFSMPKLQFLNISNNNFEGTIPTLVANLKQLLQFSCRVNRYTGTIPIEYAGKLTNLNLLDIGSNKLVTTIPSELFLMTSLVYLDISGNQLVGSIPSEIGLLTNAEKVDVSRNQLTGSVPLEIGHMTQLTQLGIYGNQLKGKLPVSYFNLTKLLSVEIFSNQLSGTISPACSSLTNLVSFTAGGNKLTGRIPSTVGSLTNVERLDVSSNTFRGDLPSEIGRLTKMTYLDVSSNTLGGTIPMDYSKLTNLNVFSFQVNDLTGSVDGIFCNDNFHLSVLEADCNVDPGLIGSITCKCCTDCNNY